MVDRHPGDNLEAAGQMPGDADLRSDAGSRSVDDAHQTRAASDEAESFEVDDDAGDDGSLYEEGEPVVDREQGEQRLFLDDPVSAVRPAVSCNYRGRTSGKHAHAKGRSSILSFDGEIPGLGVSMRTLALLCAVAVALSLLVSVVVSCSMQGAMQASLDAKYRDFEVRMTEQFDEQKAQVSELQSSLGDDVAALTTARETSDEVEEAKADLQDAVDDASDWLESGDGSWVSQHTEDMMNNAIDVAERLISETGVTDPQTYKQAEDSIQDIIDAVDQGKMW